MTRKWLLYIIPAILVATSLAGTACRKNSGQPEENRSYLVNPNDLTRPDVNKPDPIKPTADPCLKKGAVGAQALLLKEECGKVNPIKCGDGNPEGDEQCDDGIKNGKEGSKCTSDCKKNADKTDNGDDSSKVLKIITQSMPDKNLGSKYSATIKATGGKNNKDYKWTVTGLSPDFEHKSSNDSVMISSKEPTSKPGNYEPVVQVCLLSNPNDCVTCPKDVCSFSITDNLILKAYDMKDASYSIESLYKNGKQFCTAEGNTHLCGEFNITPDSMSGTYGADYKTGKGAYMFIVLHVTGLMKNDQSFAWSLSVDGKELSKSDVKTADFVKYQKNQTNKTWPEGLFLLDYAHDNKVDADSHILVFDASVAMNGGAEYKKVVVSVKSVSGAEQKIEFDRITIPSAASVQKAIDVATASNSAPPPVEFKITSLEMNGVEIKGKVFPEYGLTFIVEPEFEKFDITFHTTDPGARITKVDSSYPEYVENDKDTVTFTFPEKGTLVHISQGVMVTITSGDDKSKATAVVVMKSRYPDPKTQKVGSLSRVYVDMRTEWTDKDSRINFQVQDKEGHVLSETGDIAVDGADPTYFNQSYELKPVVAYKDLPLSQIGRVVVAQKDPGSGPSMVYDILTFRLISTYWYADICGTKKHDDGHIELSLKTVFTPSGYCGGYWSGEANGDTDSDIFDFPASFDQSVNNNWWPGQNVWKKRPHYGSANEL